MLGTDEGALVGPVLRRRDVDAHVPALCDLEIVAGLRRGLARDLMPIRRAADALQDYLDLPVTRHGHQSLIPRVLELRLNFSANDATYVALAERIGATLLTVDQHLARAAQAHTTLQRTPLDT